MRLTAMQHRFIDEYMVDLCATAAAARAGYRVPRGGVWWLTHSPRVKVALEEALAVRAASLLVRPHEVIDELRKIAFAPEAEVKARERMAALTLLGRHLGMFRDRPQPASAPAPKEDPLAALR